MDEQKKPEGTVPPHPEERDLEPAVKEPRPLTDQEAGEASGGKSAMPSWVQRGACPGTKRGSL